MFAEVREFPVYNKGIVRTPKGTFEYDIDLDALGKHPNQALGRVADAVRTAVLPIHVRHDDYLTPNLQDYVFAAHLGLATFEVHVDNRLCDEIADFLAGLPIVAPASFDARWYTLFEFRAEWTGPWWQNLRWRHVKSWEAS